MRWRSENTWAPSHLLPKCLLNTYYVPGARDTVVRITKNLIITVISSRRCRAPRMICRFTESRTRPFKALQTRERDLVFAWEGMEGPVVSDLHLRSVAVAALCPAAWKGPKQRQEAMATSVVVWTGPDSEFKRSAL